MYNTESESFQYDHHHIAIHDLDHHDSRASLRYDPDHIGDSPPPHFTSAIIHHTSASPSSVQIQQQQQQQQGQHDNLIIAPDHIKDDDTRAAVHDYTYRAAPVKQAALLDARPAPDYVLSPDRHVLALLGTYKFRSLDGLSCSEFGLAGLRLDPRTSCLSRTITYNALEIVSLSHTTMTPSSSSSRTRSVPLPDDARLMSPIFSHDSRYLAFLLYTAANNDLATESLPNPICLYYISIDDPDLHLHRLSRYPVSQIFGRPFTWTHTNSVIFRTPAPGRGPIPVRPNVPPGPVVLESGLGHDVKRRSGGARTYQDLLKDSFDCHLFEYFCTVQLVRCSPLHDDDADDVLLPLTGMIKACHPSPDGRYLLVKVLHRPYSYFIPHGRFPVRIEIHRLLDKDVVLVRQLVDLNLADSVPISFDACRVGPRHVAWRQDASATLVWVEAQDNGDPKNVPADAVRDVLWSLSEPWTSAAPVFLHAFKLRFKKIVFGDDHALVSERWFKTRQQNTWLIDLREPKQNKSRLVWSLPLDDRYSDPGQPQTHSERLVIITDPDTGYPTLTLFGDGAGPDGARPFVRSLNMYSVAEIVHWRSSSTTYERPVARLDYDRLIISRESPAQPPEFFLVSMTGTCTDLQLSWQAHPCPQMLDVQCELVHYERADGVKLSGYLYLPPGFRRDVDPPLPTVLWAYPREYKSVDMASQVTGSPNTFALDGRPSLYFLLEGYAVLDRMTMPIVAEGPDAEPNDTYIEQLVANAAAAIDHLVAIGVTDRERVGVGGHSYGAFMTANLLAHSNLFAAGVARSGAYNRTLTPFGFQKEERTLWEAPEVYHRMSPYMAADRIRTPLLLIHGQADNNAGTYPMQSERMFAALKSHAKAPTRIVLLPHESHHYKSRESNAHVLWETTRWFSKYVKHKNNPKHIRSRSIYL